MQVRKLKELLQTSYIIQESGDYVYIGSAYIHDIITINKFTLKLTGDIRDFKELTRIYNECEKLIQNGEMKSIVSNNDNIEGMQKVYVWSNWEGLIETYTDNPKWPNTDYTGRLLYDNTTFINKQEAIEYGIKSLCSAIESWNDQLQEDMRSIEKIQTRLNNSSKLLTKLLNDRKELEDVECQRNEYTSEKKNERQLDI